MPRSIEEIDKEIAEVEARIAARNEGMPSRQDPAYRAARFDYIVDGDRSGLDAYQTALNAAIQNKLNRESTDRMAKLSKESAREEDEIAWRKDMTNARTDLNDVKNKAKQGLATEKDVADAVANYNFHAERGAKKGYWGAPPPENVTNEQAPSVSGIDNMAKKKRESVAEIVAKDSASVDELKAARIECAYLQEQGADMSKELAAIDDKISKLEGPVAMKAASAALDEAIASKDPDRIEAAAQAYDQFSKIEGYEGKKSTEGRGKAKSIRSARENEKAKSTVGKTITEAMVRAALAKDEKATTLAVKDPNTGKEYTFKLQSVTRDGKEVLQVFYGGEWHDAKPKVK